MNCRLAFTPPLPGKSAQLEMAPAYRVAALMREVPPENARQSAVLVTLAPPDAENGRNGFLDWTVLLIRRNIYPGVHSGQISFPGGSREKKDSGLWETACREAFEEVGIGERGLEKVGPLTSVYVPPSNFLIQPFVAVETLPAPITADPREVVDYKRIPLKIFNPAASTLLDFDYLNGEKRAAPAWLHEDYIIWGATAMILSELYRLIPSPSIPCG